MSEGTNQRGRGGEGGHNCSLEGEVVGHEDHGTRRCSGRGEGSEKASDDAHFNEKRTVHGSTFPLVFLPYPAHTGGPPTWCPPPPTDTHHM